MYEVHETRGERGETDKYNLHSSILRPPRNCAAENHQIGAKERLSLPPSSQQPSVRLCMPTVFVCLLLLRSANARSPAPRKQVLRSTKPKNTDALVFYSTLNTYNTLHQNP
jgi:hypothetical protein